MPVPMTPPIPSSVSCAAVSVRRSSLPEASCACRSSMDLVASSCEPMNPSGISLGLYTSTPAKASQRRGRRLPEAGALGCAQILRHVRTEQFDQSAVHLRAPGDDVALLTVLTTGQGANEPAGLLDEECAGSGIPGRQADLPESIHAPGGDVSQVERGGARTAHAGGLLGNRTQHRHVGG